MGTTPLVTIFVRHSADCKYHGDEFEKRCRCRKHFRWSQGGEQYRRKANTRSWAEAEEGKRLLEDQLAGRKLETCADTEGVLIASAVETFKRDKSSQGLAVSTTLPYNLELKRFREFCESRGCFTVARINFELLIDYRHTWTQHYPSSTTRALVQTRLKHFLRFCVNAGWLDTVPKLQPIKIDEPETLPLTAKEYADLLKATADFPLHDDRLIVRALIQAMRWSGLAVHDAANLRRDQVIHNGQLHRITVSRQKTGTDVMVPIPADVAAEILNVSAGEYVFKHGAREGSEASHAHYMGQKIRRAFEYAGIETEGHMISHRLRDTFAVDLLEKGVPLEEVSKLLGHTSIRTTERHYAKWVKGRQDRLDNLVTEAWAK